MTRAILNHLELPPHFFRDLLLVLFFGCLITLFLTVFLGRPKIWVVFTYVQSISLGIFFSIQISSKLKFGGKTSPTPYVIGTPIGAIIGIGSGALIAGENLFTTNSNLLVVTASTVVFGTAVSYYFYSRHKMAESQSVLQEENILRLRNQQQLIEANLKLLQAQIEPHFLFNTLSNVLGLMDSDVENAKIMLDKLTQYLRITLKRTRQADTTLAEELDLLRIYLDIQSIRMGKRLNYRIDVADNLMDTNLPPLLLQPLVENAVKHGLEPKVDGGEVTISARADNNMLTLNVTDTGLGFQQNTISGVGLSNIRARLLSLFGEKSKLTITDNTPAGVSASFSIPAVTNNSYRQQLQKNNYD